MSLSFKVLILNVDVVLGPCFKTPLTKNWNVVPGTLDSPVNITADPPAVGSQKVTLSARLEVKFTNGTGSATTYIGSESLGHPSAL